MSIIPIPKEITKGEELIVIPRKEYEKFLRFRFKNIKEVSMTSIQKKALVRARKNMAQGKFLTIHELKQRLENKNR